MSILEVIKEDLEYLIDELTDSYNSIEGEWGSLPCDEWEKLEIIKKRYKIK